MIRLRLIFIIAALAILILPLFAADKMVIRFEEPASSVVNQFTRPEYDVAAYRPGKFLDIVVTPSELAAIREQGFGPVITQTERRLKDNLVPKTRNIPGYRTYNDVLEELENIAEEYSDITRLYNIGDSWGKIYTDANNDNYEDYYFDIWALKLTAAPDSPADKPAVYYFGAHHAREPLSVEVPMDFLHLLLNRYGEDEEVTYLVDNTEIWFVPLVNPDGHKVVLSRDDVWWRKNIRDNNENGRFDTSNYFGRGTDGVDLNRNYAHEWRYDHRNHLATYPGPEPGSEPEVACLKQLMSDVHFVAGISYHTYSELVLFPYGYARGCRAPDHTAMEDLAVEMAATIPALYGEGHYEPMQSLELYPARGTTCDYAYGRYGIFSYTFELATEFIPAPEEVEQVVADNMEAAMTLLRRVHRSMLTGTITDAITGEPLEAEIFIEGIDNTASFRHPYTSRERFGRYYRLLVPGDYRVAFRKEGYINAGQYYVTITEDEQTTLDVSLFDETDNYLGQLLPTGNENDVYRGEIGGVNVVFTPDVDEDQFVTIDLFVSTSPYLDAVQLFSNPDALGRYFQFTVSSGGVFRRGDYLQLAFNEQPNQIWVRTGSGGWTQVPDDDIDWTNPLSPVIDLTGLFGRGSRNGTFEFAGDSGGPNTLPVELSSFAASVTSQMFVHLKWTSETETNMLGYNIYRSTTEKMSEAVRINNEIIPANNSSTTTEYDYEDREVIIGETYYYWLQTLDLDLSYCLFGPITVTLEDEEETVPPVYVTALKQNYPNPFNPGTNLRFSLRDDTEVALSIYNILGRKIRTLTKRPKEAGYYEVSWDSRDDQGQTVSSGIYFYRLTTEHYDKTRKMLLVK